jgi:filamin
MLNYGSEPVPGCPILVQAEEAGAAKAEGPGLLFAHVGMTATFSVSGPGLPGVPAVSVEGPDSVAKCEVKRITSPESGHFQASFVPMEVGVFDIRVTWAGIDIPGEQKAYIAVMAETQHQIQIAECKFSLPGSPFHPRVVDGTKLRVIGGWEAHVDEENIVQLAVGEERRIAFNTIDAGPGLLEARMDSTDSTQVISDPEDSCRVETAAGSRSKLVLNPKRPGDYRLVLKWGSYDIESAPKLLYVHAPPTG